MRKLTSLAIVCTAIVILVGCNSCGKKGGNHTMPPSNSSNTQLWKKYDTPPGADPSVPDSLGGTGFEKIAEKMGFVTYVPKEEELKYFGDSRAKTGGEIRSSISRFPLSFRPFFYGQNANFTENLHMSTLCYESLVGQHPVTREYTPALASHWKISDDKMTYTFRIDPNSRWSDGKPVVAQDVVATFNLVMDESILSPSMQQSFEKYDKPVALSKYIVQVHAKEKDWRSFQTFGTSLTILQNDEIGGITGKEFLDKFQFNMPVGSGEYIILNQDIVKQQSYTYTRRDDYWAKDYPMSKYAGNFDRVYFEVIKDNPTLEYEKFKKGEFDHFWFTSVTTEQWINDTSYSALSNGWIKRFRCFTNGPAGSGGIYFNMRKAPFDDIRVRQAFAYLFDRESIIQKVLYNEYLPIDSYYGNTPYENPGNPKFRYDPEKAAKLLAEAGWSQKNQDGILTKNGKPFVVEISIVKPIEKFITLYQETLKKAGIDLQIKLQDGNAITKNVAERNFNITWANYGGLIDPNPKSSLQSDLADKNDNNNITGFKNSRVDQLIVEYDTTFDMTRRIDIIKEVDKIEMEVAYAALSWTPKGIRIAYWDKFGMPEYVYGRYTQTSQHDVAAALLWWYDADKAARLEEAKKNNTKTDGNTGISIFDFWLKFK